MATENVLHLDARLRAAARLVRPGHKAADIGCDHGKLSAALVCGGRCPFVIAADLRPGPLSVARANIQAAGCADRVELRLGDGLEVLRPGEALPAHEFHYWDCTENGDALTAKKPVGRRSWPCVVADGNLFAGFPHLYLPARPKCALRFCQAAARWRRGR